MKLIKILFSLILISTISGCSDDGIQDGFEGHISTYIVSFKSDSDKVIYCQTPRSTEKFSTEQRTFDYYNVGDTMKVLIHNRTTRSPRYPKSGEVEASIRNYTISDKANQSTKYGANYYIYFNSKTSTECCQVDYETYSKLKVGDGIIVLFKHFKIWYDDSPAVAA